MRLAVVGCGYVAEFYGATLHQHPSLKLVGAFDLNPQNLRAFTERFATRAYPSLEVLLGDPGVDLVLVLTNPRTHYEVTRRCLEAGKHVYSEKPLAMDAKAARELADLAQEKGVYLSSAPCSVLSETAQTMWKAIRDGAIGKVRLAYANFDEGMIAPAQAPWNWRNGSGVAWPAKDEFEVGCTYEHAGYVLTWLAAFFGPARAVTAFASCLIPEKGVPVATMAPDFSVGCIEYPEGIVARVTCGLVAPEDRSLVIVGDDGVLSTSNVRDDAGPVYVRRLPVQGREHSLERRLNPVRRWLQSVLPSVPWSGSDWHMRRRYPSARPPSKAVASGNKRVDFCRGLSEMAAAIQEQRPSRLSADLGVHVVELIEALQYPDPTGARRDVRSTFEPIAPLPWRDQAP